MNDLGNRFGAALNKTARAFKDSYGSKRIAFMAPIGFTSGLPWALVGSTLAAWMSTEGIDLRMIGLTILFTLPYNLKFLWAPVFDRFSLPILSRRRGWMVCFQLAAGTSVWILGSADPTALSSIAWCALMVSFTSASLDAVSDAYRTELLTDKERASGGAIFINFYRVANILTGAGALILAEHVSWQTVYRILASLMLLGVIATLFAPVPKHIENTPKSIRSAVFDAWKDFFSRPKALILFSVALTYKVGDTVASQMMMPFLINELDFSTGEVGIVVKVFGLGSLIIGSLVGGGLVSKMGLKKSLLVFGVLQAGANALYVVLALSGKSYGLLVSSVCIDYVFNGLGSAAFIALLMSLCNRRFTAAQYAILSSAATVIAKLIASTSGFLVEGIGWPGFFLLTLVAASPALVLLTMLRPEHLKQPDS